MTEMALGSALTGLTNMAPEMIRAMKGRTQEEGSGLG